MSFSEHPDFEEALRQYYQILRCRQSQIIGIIKETSELVETLQPESNNPNLDKNADRKIKLAFSLINSLANLLDEQMNALDIWERILPVSRFPLPSETTARNDFEISIN